MVDITEVEQKKEKRIKRNEDRVREHWDDVKCVDIHVIGVPERGERERKGQRTQVKA